MRKFYRIFALAILACCAVAYGQPPLTPTIDGRQIVVVPDPAAVCRWESFSSGRIRLTVVENGQFRDYWLTVTLAAEPGPVVPPGPVTPPVTPPGPVTPPVQPPDPTNPPSNPNTKATAVVYVYEKDQSKVPPFVASALQKLNAAGSGIVATEFEDDATNGTGDVPRQYRVALAAARTKGLPCLVVTSGDTVLKTVKNPTTEAEVLEAIR